NFLVAVLVALPCLAGDDCCVVALVVLCLEAVLCRKVGDCHFSLRAHCMYFSAVLPSRWYCHAWRKSSAKTNPINIAWSKAKPSFPRNRSRATRRRTLLRPPTPQPCVPGEGKQRVFYLLSRVACAD